MMCKEVVEFLMEYLDGNMPAQVRADFEQHLNRCRDCVDFLRTYRATIHMGRSACEMCEDEKLPPIPEGLVRAILKARQADGSAGDSPRPS